MVKNIRLINPNMVRVGSYFYSFNEETDVMIQKADDGTLAFAYPLDTTIDSEITTLEHDGESFWTQENIDDGDADAGFRIRRWLIENFAMVLQQTFLFDTDTNDTFESQAMTIEHYEAVFTSGAVENTTTFTVSFETEIFDLITPGTKLFLGPSTKLGFVGETESVTVTSTGPGKLITISKIGGLDNGFLSSDDLVFSKNIWFFNQHFQKTLNQAALYKANVLDGSLLLREQSGTFQDINATTFHELDSFTGDLAVHNKPYLVFIRTTNLLFLNTNDSNLTIELSSIQNNIDQDTIVVFTVYDMGIEAETIFRLQKKFSINNGSTETESTFNYQLATFVPFPIAIAMTAEPAILPADSGASNSIITATVTDQYGLPFVTSPAAQIVFTTSGGGTGSNITPTGSQNLDPNGQAVATYFTGDAAGLVTISATVTIT